MASRHGAGGSPPRHPSSSSSLQPPSSAAESQRRLQQVQPPPTPQDDDQEQRRLLSDSSPSLNPVSSPPLVIGLHHRQGLHSGDVPAHQQLGTTTSSNSGPHHPNSLPPSYYLDPTASTTGYRGEHDREHDDLDGSEDDAPGARSATFPPARRANTDPLDGAEGGSNGRQIAGAAATTAWNRRSLHNNNLPPAASPHVRFSDELVRPAVRPLSLLDDDGEMDDGDEAHARRGELYTIHSVSGPPPQRDEQHGQEVGSRAQPPRRSEDRFRHSITAPDRQRSGRRARVSASSLEQAYDYNDGRPTPGELGFDADAMGSGGGRSAGRKAHVSFTAGPAGEGAQGTGRYHEEGGEPSSFKLPRYGDWIARQRKKARDPRARLKAQAGAYYKKYIVEGLLRQRPLPPSKDGRHVPLLGGGGDGDGRGWKGGRPALTDERSGRPYAPNFIRSSRYTVWDFVPRQLFFQFGKLANFYFLVIGVMQMIPGLSTTGTYTTIGPLIAFVGLSMAKEGYDDYRRYRLDKVENRSEAHVLDLSRRRDGEGGARRGGGGLRDRLGFGGQKQKKVRFEEDAGGGMATELRDVGKTGGGSGSGSGSGTGDVANLWKKVQWQDVRVGDVVRLRRDENVPADLVLLWATGPNGVAYIETMALDGETNLKSKQACPLLAALCEAGDVERMAKAGAEVVSEDPNLDLYNFEGRATVGDETMPLTLNQVVYRGSTLRNTAEAWGMVVNTGEECKIRMNAHKNVHAKAPSMQFVVNRIIILLVIFVVLLSIGCTAGNEIWKHSYEPRAWYIAGAQVPFKEIFIGFVIAFNTLIPLSLYVSLEIIKLGQLYLLHDVEMYDPVTDTPMVANTTTILENLGQVSYIFSDKTGTLTENLMKFRKMSVAGTAWLHDPDIRKEAEEKERREMKRRASEMAKGRGGGGESTRRPSRQLLRDEVPLIRHDRRASAASGAASSIAQPPPPPRRSVSSASHWRSTARPTQAQPELNTEDLIGYLRHRPHTTFSRKARHFILCIALCHTCLPEVKPDGSVEFQAASPDELALVEAAQELGYLLIDRPAQAIKLRFVDADGRDVEETYEVLEVIEFSSRRKRMSIVVRLPDGRITLFCKGADSVILPRLKLSHLAIQKASVVERRASKRKSMEQERALLRRMSNSGGVAAAGSSAGPAPPPTVGPAMATTTTPTTATTAMTPRNSVTLSRAATTLSRRANSIRGNVRRSTSLNRMSGVALTDEVDHWLTRRETEDLDRAARASDDGAHHANAYATPRTSFARQRSMDVVDDRGHADDGRDADFDPYEGMVDEALARNDGAIFERCFSHVDDFASEGLRTLLFAYRVLEEGEYDAWQKTYREAASSLDHRQERIEEAADAVEKGFDLAGATAIEDKLQQGVPDTIDKLRRANVKVWMLTGDKRETAINIAHSARICKPFSEVYVLDAAAQAGGVEALHAAMTATLVDVARGMVPHSVVVVDGHTLGVVEDDEALAIMFFDLVTRVDSVICCRAAPAQKATLVKCIRDRVPSSLTLAIGDGANDIAMIQASHVGVGISGREGLQAARIADYSIAQFRFLQRLLFVHGRWNYIRTGKYILGTFWKEIVFYLVQAMYQRYNGYTGTSLYEPASLTVFNTLFTSLPVILLGIFEQDLHADTLLAVPELYTYGQRNEAFNFRKYVGWMTLGVIEAFVIFYTLYGFYSNALFTADTTLFAMGDLAFTVCVIFINVKMLVLELHNQTIISYLGLFISVSGWFVWNIFLAVIYKELPGPYLVRHSFLKNFGRNYMWWATGVLALVAVIVLELAVAAIRRAVAPTDQDTMQVVEHYDGVLQVMREHAAERGEALPAAVAQGHKDRGDDVDDDDDASDYKGKGVVTATTTSMVQQQQPPRRPSLVSRKSSGGGRAAGRSSVDATGPTSSSSVVEQQPPPPSFNETVFAAANPAPPGLGRRLSRRLDDDHYVPPPFTPPAEEREDPVMDLLVGGARGRTPTTATARNPPPRPSVVVAAPSTTTNASSGASSAASGGATAALDPAAGGFTLSPVELQLPPSLPPGRRRSEAAARG